MKPPWVLENFPIIVYMIEESIHSRSSHYGDFMGETDLSFLQRSVSYYCYSVLILCLFEFVPDSSCPGGDLY